MDNDKQPDILHTIVAHKRQELDEQMRTLPLSRLIAMVEEKMKNEDEPPVSMRRALMQSDTGIIAEFKRKSPSKGWINRGAGASTVPLAYQRQGAAALSILTDEHFFGGNDTFITEARNAGVTIPILYKNFVISEYQILQARLCGASAVLLIAADLKKDECRQLLHTAHELGMEVLLEMHGEDELEYAELEPDMYGINNRNLGTFVTDVENSFRMAELLPRDVCKVSESGISHPDTVRRLRSAGYRGFLMGEHFMRNEDPGLALSQFISQLKAPDQTTDKENRRRLTIKVCGMRYNDNISEVARLDIDLMGFIFAPGSPRYTPTVPTDAPTERVGVFVNAAPQEIVQTILDFRLRYVQLHGDESPVMVAELKRQLAAAAPDVKIIKAFGVAGADDLSRCKAYEGLADLFLFDTRCPTQGGSGRQFDWSVLQTYRGATPFLLSGGIGPGDAQRIRQFRHPMLVGIDVNSRFETAPGRKDAELLRDFIARLRE